ncbi:hypothetical protein FRX31_029809 [Thalictrum thalictroides]|uniref:Uncharacterized protein n=1 Tax=Thalictrum thalictroides TaxID=46969 RepID=A0A7J6V669_THATH|nr:hypothetical protein FRX31_029809 [Thalictrum thalictroides]
MNANNLVENEMAKFQERLSRSMVVCQDKFETATKFQQQKGRAMNDLESCVDHAIQDSIQMLPHVVNQLKANLSINEKL